MKALVIGYGSIGQRHARLLDDADHDVAVVSRRPVDHPERFDTINAAVQAFRPDYAVIASKTVEHRDDIEALSLAGFQGQLLIEKPVYDHGAESPPESFAGIKVAYNLRFHPALLKFRDVIAGRRVHTATVYTGSYLPGWRPDTDYRRSYSSSRAEGGGVLRDLSHELDYALWLFGSWRRVAAIGGTFGALEIDSDDVYSLLIETENVPSLTIGINYLDSQTRREILAITDTGSVRLDLIRGILETDGDVEHFDVGRDDTYMAQHNAMTTGDFSVICDIREGLDVMRLIDAAEHAALNGTWQAA